MVAVLGPRQMKSSGPVFAPTGCRGLDAVMLTTQLTPWLLSLLHYVPQFNVLTVSEGERPLTTGAIQTLGEPG